MHQNWLRAYYSRTGSVQGLQGPLAEPPAPVSVFYHGAQNGGKEAHDKRGSILSDDFISDNFSSKTWF